MPQDSPVHVRLVLVETSTIDSTPNNFVPAPLPPAARSSRRVAGNESAATHHEGDDAARLFWKVVMTDSCEAVHLGVLFALRAMDPRLRTVRDAADAPSLRISINGHAVDDYGILTVEVRVRAENSRDHRVFILVRLPELLAVCVCPRSIAHCAVHAHTTCQELVVGATCDTTRTAPKATCAREAAGYTSRTVLPSPATLVPDKRRRGVRR